MKNWKEILKLWLGALLIPFAVVAEAVGTGCKKLRTLPKKAVALCVAAALVVAMIPAYVFAAETTYDIWVGGVQVTSANKDNIVVPGATGAATYDPAANTLTLDNFSYTGKGYNFAGNVYALIYSQDIDLKIVLKGTNTLAGADMYQEGIIIENGSLMFANSDEENVTGSLKLTAGYPVISLDNGSLSVENVNLTVINTQSPTGNPGAAIFVNGNILIINSDVTAISGDSDGDDIPEEGATFGITTTGSISVANSTVSAIGYAVGIWAGSLSVANSTVTAAGNLHAMGYINTEEGLVPNLTGDYVVYAGDDAASATKADAPTDDTYASKYVKIEPVCTVTVNYGVDGVNNKEIAVTKGDTISLENPVIDGYIFMGWYANENFTTAFDFDTPITAATTVYAKFADYEGDKKTLQDAIDALEADVTELNKLTENGGAIDQINAKISAIESQIAVLDELKNKYAEADTALKQQLQAADAAINAAIAALTTCVQDLEADLAAAKSNISTNASEVAQLTADLVALNASLTNLSNKLANEYATKAELTSAINSATATIEQAIYALTTRVQILEADLAEANSKIDTNTSDVGTLKSDVATLKTWKIEAEDAINALKTLTSTQSADISILKRVVQDLEAELAAAEARIDAAEVRIAALEGRVSALEIAKQNLDAAVAALNVAINNKADTATLNQKVTDLIAAIAAAEDAAKTYADGKDTALQTQLTAAIATAKGEAITAAENLVNTAKAELQTAINNKADIATLNAKVAELNAAIATAEATAKAYTDSAVTTLNAAIITAKDEAVDAAKDLVNTAKAQLQAAIDNKADTATVNAAIANLQNAITALENAKDNYIAADAALKAELEEKIAKAKQEAIDAAKGHIPYIGTNGNWWIGDTDTGVDANGIKGDKGDKGDTGADGVGIAKIEKTATDGNVDTYTVTLTNGKTYTFTVTNGKDGVNGKDGENGKEGADGKDGLTPFIGENGNWWIGDTDTGVKAVAEQTAQKGTDTITVVSIVVASVALLSNLALVVWIVTKKKKVLV